MKLVLFCSVSYLFVRGFADVLSREFAVVGFYGAREPSSSYSFMYSLGGLHVSGSGSVAEAVAQQSEGQVTPSMCVAGAL